MIVVVAVVACEAGFWLVLAVGLWLRYVRERRRLGGWVLAGVPAVDLALLVLTVIDLRHGATPRWEHGLAAVYLGFSVPFGPALVRWADARVSCLRQGAPLPQRPGGGTPERVRLEWRVFGAAVLGAAISAVLLLAAAALVGDEVDRSALLQWLPRLGAVLAVWLIGWPLWETVRLVVAPAERSPR